MIPKTIKNFNVFIEGFSMAGIADECTLPKLTRKSEEHQAGGMLGPVDLDFGMEKMEIAFSLKEYVKEVLKQWGVQDVSGVGVRFLGAANADSDANAQDAIEIAVRGRWMELDPGTVKRGEASTLKVTMPLTYFKYSVNGEVLIEIDLVNNIEIIGGVDRQAETRNSLSL